MVISRLDPAAQQIVANIRAHWRRQGGWRLFVSDGGRWWATTTRRPITPARFPAANSAFAIWAPDAVDADTYTELAAKLERR